MTPSPPLPPPLALAVEHAAAGRADTARDTIYRAVDSLMRGGDLAAVRAIVAATDPTTHDPDICVSVLSSTLPVCTQVPERAALAESLCLRLVALGEDAGLELSGLEHGAYQPMADIEEDVERALVERGHVASPPVREHDEDGFLFDGDVYPAGRPLTNTDRWTESEQLDRDLGREEWSLRGDWRLPGALPGRPYIYAQNKERNDFMPGLHFLVFHPDDEGRVRDAMEECRAVAMAWAEATAARIVRKAAALHASSGGFFSSLELMAHHGPRSWDDSTTIERTAVEAALEAAGFQRRYMEHDADEPPAEVWFR